MVKSLHLFAVGIGLGPEPEQRFASELVRVAEDFQLQAETLWRVRSRAGSLIAGGVHHAERSIGQRSYVHTGEDRVVFFDGLPVDGSRLFPAHCAARLDAHWSSLPASLEGQFAAVRIDLIAGVAQVLCDPLGLLPVFYARCGHAAVASNSAGLITALLHAERVDPLATASFVAVGWAVDRRSFRAEISALAGGSVHTLDVSGRRSAQHFGPWVLGRRDRTRSSARALATELVALTSTAAQAGGAVRCALTAGHDTRVLAAILRAANTETTYYTVGEPASMDVRIGKELANHFRLQHEVQTRSESALDWTAAASRFMRQNDGLAGLGQLSDYVELEHPVNELQIIVSGLGGEIGRAGTGPLSNVAPNLPLASRLFAIQRRLLFLKVDDQGLLTAEGRALVTDYLSRFVRQRRLEGCDARELTEVFYAFERVACWGATATKRVGPYADFFSPFCTRPFIRYCFSLKPGERYVEAPHHRLLAALDPALLAHRFETPFRPQRPRLAGVLATRQLLETLHSRRRGGATPQPRSRVESPFLDRWLEARVGLIARIADEAPSEIWDLIDRRRFSALLAGDADARAAYRDRLLNIATPLWLLADPVR